MELGVPFSAAYIVNSAPEEFLLLQRRFLLNRQQLALCKDIRRRGKNKVSTTQYFDWEAVQAVLRSCSILASPKIVMFLKVLIFHYRYLSLPSNTGTVCWAED